MLNVVQKLEVVLNDILLSNLFKEHKKFMVLTNMIILKSFIIKAKIKYKSNVINVS